MADMRTVLFGMCVSLIVTLTAAVAQDDAALGRSFEGAMRKAIPSSQVLGRRQGTPGIEILQWTLEDSSTLTVRLIVHGSARAANTYLRTQADDLPVGTRKVQGFGDDAFVVISQSATGKERIVFRRERVVVSVEAIGLDRVQELAKLFDSEVVRSLRSGAVP